MKHLMPEDSTVEQEFLLATRQNNPAAIILPELLSTDASLQLSRMFRDPRVLNAGERTELIACLRQAVELAPHVAEVKVLLGMALSVDLQVQEALEVLRTAARQAPDSFIARLKFGELLMRLRICEQAQVETHEAALLAANAIQSDLARKQAATIRTMLREGIERGGYGGLLGRVFRFPGRKKKQTANPALERFHAAS